MIGELPVEHRQLLLREMEHMPEKFVRRRGRTFYNVLRSAMRGVATGASLAGIVNTVAPGVIPTFLGYLVGKGFGDILVQGGLITLGMFASHSVNATAVLGVCAAFGGTLGGIIGVTKEIMRKSRRRKKT